MCRAVGKPELSEPTVVSRIAEDHQLKVTPGIDSEIRVCCPIPQQCGKCTAYNGEPKTGLPLFEVLSFWNTVGSRKEVCFTL